MQATLLNIRRLQHSAQLFQNSISAKEKSLRLP